MPVRQLRECHGEKLIQTREVLDFVLAAIGGHAAAKGAQGQVGHELGEHELALVHEGPRRIRATDRQSDLRRSNRNQTQAPNSANKSLTYEALMRERWDPTEP